MKEEKNLPKSLRTIDFFRKSVLSISAYALLLTCGVHAGNITPAKKSQDEDAVGTRIGAYLLNVNLGFFSDKVSRGYTETSGEPSVEGEFKITHGLLYVGMWASNLNLQGCETCATAHSEFDFYGGLEKELLGLDFELEAKYVAFPGVDSPTEPYNFWEYKFGIKKALTERLTMGAALYYSPNSSLDTGVNWVYELNAELKLPQIAIFSPAICGEAAYQDGDVSKGGTEYWYWNVGLEFGFAKHYKLDFRYHDVVDVVCTGDCGSKAVAGLKAEF